MRQHLTLVRMAYVKKIGNKIGMNVEETDITNILLVEIKINVWKLCVFFSREMVWRFKKK